MASASPRRKTRARPKTAGQGHTMADAESYKAYVFMDLVLWQNDGKTASNLQFQLQRLRKQFTRGKVHYSVRPAGRSVPTFRRHRPIPLLSSGSPNPAPRFQPRMHTCPHTAHRRTPIVASPYPHPG